jgi:hypothetical protein
MISVSLAITGHTGKIKWRRLSPPLSGLTRGLRFGLTDPPGRWGKTGHHNYKLPD